jgi:RND family efflux transporter MFP subunit
MTTPAPDDPHALGFDLPPPATTSRLTIALALTGVIGGAFAFAYLRRDHARAALAPPSAADTRPVHVEVTKATVVAGDRTLTLPGTLRALEEAQIRPRVSGYVRRWLVDLGDHVTAGQLLAEIDTPEVDAQLGQARAQLAQARAAVKQVTAQRDYSRSNTTRFATLSDQQLVSKGQLEQTQAQAATDEASVAAAQANVAAAEANVHRLSDLAGFARVVAPFAGTVTTRAIERGALVSEAATTPLFTIVAIDPIRVFVDVPQSAAAAIQRDLAATITVRELPGRPFKGTLTRAAGALDPELHTMIAELQIPNPDGALLPGMYVQAQLELPVARKVFEIPSTALYSDAQGVRVAIVDAAHKIHFVTVAIERDTGATLQLATGLTGDERLVKVAVPSLVEGQVVDVSP